MGEKTWGEDQLQVRMYAHATTKAGSLYATEKIKNEEKLGSAWVWWLMPAIPVLRRLKQEYHGLEVNLGYIVSSNLGFTVRPCL